MTINLLDSPLVAGRRRKTRSRIPDTQTSANIVTYISQQQTEHNHDKSEGRQKTETCSNRDKSISIIMNANCNRNVSDYVEELADKNNWADPKRDHRDEPEKSKQLTERESNNNTKRKDTRKTKGEARQKLTDKTHNRDKQ